MVIFSKKNGGRITDGDIMGIGFSWFFQGGFPWKSAEKYRTFHDFGKSAPVLLMKNRLRITLAGFPRKNPAETQVAQGEGSDRRSQVGKFFRGNASMEVLGVLGTQAMENSPF